MIIWEMKSFEDWDKEFYFFNHDLAIKMTEEERRNRKMAYDINELSSRLASDLAIEAPIAVNGIPRAKSLHEAVMRIAEGLTTKSTLSLSDDDKGNLVVSIKSLSGKEERSYVLSASTPWNEPIAISLKKQKGWLDPDYAWVAPAVKKMKEDSSFSFTEEFRKHLERLEERNKAS